MAKKVTIDIEVNGKMQKATLSAKKLKKALDETKASQDGLNASTRKGYRAMQGSAQATSNSTKAFSKQAGVVGGLVPVYATFAANVFAVSAAFGVLKRAAALERLETSLERIGALSGRNLGALAADLRAVADQAISTEQSLRAVSVGTSAGFSSSQILQLAEVAKGASLALGRDMGDAIDRLIRGTAKLEPEILDELGIIVRLDQAALDYATSLGKTANQLSQFEKVQAFVNATITQGLTKYQKISEAVDPSPYDKLAASFNNLSKEIVVFSNNILGPIINFFATNKIALTAALTFFAGTLVKQVIPAIDEVVARNRLIAVSAAQAAKKSKKVIEGSYEGIAKKLKVTDVTPPVAKQLIPKIKAGEASIAQLKKAILSLSRSEKARDAQAKKMAGAAKQEYDAETAAIKAQRAELEKLINAEKGRATYTTAGRSAASTSRIGKRTAAYSEKIDQAGFAQGIAIATEGVKRNAAEVAKAGDVYGKLGASARVAGSAVTLFGRAFLNAIPIIGQALFVISLIGPALSAIFGPSGVQKSIQETNERFKIFTKTVSLVTEEIKESSSEFSTFAIQARASVGVFDEIKQAFIRLGTTIDEEAIERYKEAIEAQEKFRAAASTRAPDPSSIKTPDFGAQEALDAIGKVSKSDALAVLAAAEARLGNMENVLPSVDKGLEALKAQLFALGEEGTISIEKINKALSELAAPVNSFVGNIKTATQQFSDFGAEVAKLQNRQITPFSAAIDQSKEFQKSTNAAFKVFFDENPGKLATSTSLKELEEQFPQAVKFAKMLAREMNMPVESVFQLQAQMENFNTLLEQANHKVITANGELKKQQEILKRISREEGIGAAFTELKLEQEDKVVDAQIDALDAQRDMVELLLDGTAETERQAKITADIKALEESRKSDAQKLLETKKAEFAEAKRIFDIQKKLDDLNLKDARLDFEQQGRDDQRTLRAERESNPFAFLDEQERGLDLEIARTKELLDAQKATVDDRAARARELASLEYEVLAARLAAEAEIARTRAEGILGDPNSSKAERTGAENMIVLADKLDSLSARVGAQSTKAGEVAAKETEAGVDTLTAKLEGLEEQKANLNDINTIINGTARSLESNMTGAFTALISGTKSAKQAFADMAKAILADIAAMIAKQLVLKMLIAATGGAGGFFGSLFGRQGGIFEPDPSMRYGGVAEKVQQFTGGGIARGRQAGYPAILHGTEAVVPLPNGKEIPVDMRNGSGQTNNVTVNVSIDGNGQAEMASQSSSNQGANIGNAIAMAVQKELVNQKRAGGILSPYGAS
tara:strand:+ start:4643 stop:8515 length:3873 start_codon:yes stop_codon:yes gene_type:complete